MFFFTFHCLDPLFEVHKGVVFNLLHSFNSTESANGTVPSTSKAIKICDVCDAVHLSNVSLRFSSVTVAVRFLRDNKLSLSGWVLNLDRIQRVERRTESLQECCDADLQ